MKKVFRIALGAAAGLSLAAAAWALPGNANNSAMHLSAVQGQAAPQTQSVSGTIASVEKTSFALTVSSQAGSRAHAEAVQSENPKTMKFQINKNTTIDGTLKVGANADVTYRQDSDGNNIAISVRVTS